MPTTLTADHILALAPDPSSAQAGRGLANLRKWEHLGQSESAAWGECQGSGKDPYRVQIDLREPVFRCSCPSRKFPCKHGIGLLLLLAAQPTAFTTSEPPPWVAEWLAKREQASAKHMEPAATPPSDTSTKKRSSKSTSNREANVVAGVNELERWLHDLVRQGLATLQGRRLNLWDAVAKRMIDAQAPGLARMVRDLATIPTAGAGWQAQLLERLARIHLLIEGYKRSDQLPPDLLAEVRSQIGWPQDQEQLRAMPGIRDTWIVLGQRVSEEDQLRSQRTWLSGRTTQRTALILAFAAPGQSLDRSLIPGTQIDAELVYFHGRFPLRALVKERFGTPDIVETLPGYPSVQSAIASYAAGLALNPWLEYLPCALQQVIPLNSPDGWLVSDTTGDTLPLAVADLHGWRMLAMSGGQPITLFGEWDGRCLHVLSSWAEQGFVRLH